jgi:PIN domain nuclease of toxin-antitoxin system
MQKNNKILLDTSAIIALIKKEKGYQIVDDILATSAISTVNFSELIAALVREGVSSEDIDEITENIIPDIIPFDHETSIVAGKLITTTNSKGLSLGDRACIATALQLDLPVYTADKIWAELDIPNLKLKLIR